MKIRDLRTHLFILSLFLMNVTGCGGGSGADKPVEVADPVANRVPVLSTDTLDELEENRARLGTIRASDPDGDELEFAISGNDAHLMGLSSAGTLSFLAAPDYERPRDSDNNNKYEFRVTVSDGNLTASIDLQVRILDVDEQKWDQVLYDEGKLE